MSESAMTRVMNQIHLNLKISSQKSHEDLLKRKEKGLVQASYKCEKCRDTGWILKKQEHGQPIAIPCECRSKNKVKNQWKSCGINPEMVNYKFGNYEEWNKNSEKMKNTALAYFSDFNDVRGSRRNSIMLCGQVGSGKTHLCIAIAINLLKANTKVVYMPYRDAITKIKQNMLDVEYYKKSISKYQTAEVLFIDDLFKGKINESDINIMFEIINYRYLNYLPIIVSSEFCINKLVEFDQGVGSRIYEMCKDYIVEIDKNLRNNYRLK